MFKCQYECLIERRRVTRTPVLYIVSTWKENVMRYSYASMIHQCGEVTGGFWTQMLCNGWRLNIIWCFYLNKLVFKHLSVILAVLVLQSEYSGITWSIPWRVLSWLLASPGHQQLWYWLCRIRGYSFPSGMISSTCGISEMVSRMIWNTTIFLCFIAFIIGFIS